MAMAMPRETLAPHPAATLFPMLPRDELDALAADIAANGLRDPIVIFDGQVLDGRNRLAACVLVGVKPTFATLDQCESPVAYVLSRNLHRRHLTAIERATIAASPEVLDVYRAAARERMAKGGKAGGAVAGRGRPRGEKASGHSDRTPVSTTEAIVEAARAVGAGEANAKRMDRVRRVAPEVFERARKGEFATVTDAVRAAGIEIQPRAREADETAAPPSERPAPSSSATPSPMPPGGRQLDEQVRALVLDGHPQADIARQLRIAPTSVHYIVRRLGLTVGNPLQGPLDFAVEATDSFDAMARNWKPDWSTASRAQNQELVDQLSRLKRAIHTFVQRLNKEAKE